MQIGSVEEEPGDWGGGVWVIAQVNAEDEQADWKEVVRRRRGGKKKNQKVEYVEPEGNEREINVVLTDKNKFVRLGHGEITVDTALQRIQFVQRNGARRTRWRSLRSG